jgi:hypothetical protein
MRYIQYRKSAQLTITVASEEDDFVFDVARNCSHGVPDRCNLGVHCTAMLSEDPTGY